jgi:putative SOS response-associated peptidase YedK
VCGRYELHSHPAAIALAFGLAHAPEIVARYNIAPGTSVPVVRVNAEGERELVALRWGFVPRWARDPHIGHKMINARAETAAVKPSYRIAFRRHRCLLPADGFFEWQATAAGRRPLHVRLASREVMGLAGLYERWMSGDGTVLDTCTILTIRANELLRDVHERMPLIIAPGDYQRWLDPANPDVQDLLQPFPAGAMCRMRVSSAVNGVDTDDASLIAPLADDAELAEPEAEPVPAQASLF